MYVEMSLERNIQLDFFKKLLIHIATQLSLNGYLAYYNGLECSKNEEEPPCIIRWIK